MAMATVETRAGVRTIQIPGKLRPKLHEKTVAATSEEQVLLPNEGYDGFSSVTIEATPTNIELQEKTVTPSAQLQEVVPDSGYYGMSKVIVEAAKLAGDLLNAEEAVF